MAMLLLFVAIAAEVGATSLLPRTDSFRHPGWTALVLAGYGVAVWLLAVVVQRVPVSIAYAIWAGLGTAAVALIGMVVLGESWNGWKIVALSMIVVGVVLLNLQRAG